MFMQHNYAVSGYWRDDFDEEKMRAWATALREQLRAAKVSLGIVFMTPHYFGCAAQILEVLRLHAQIPLLIGCSGGSLIIGSREIEEQRGLVVSLLALPGAELHGVHFTQEQVEQASGPAFWHSVTGLNADQINGWLVLADPFTLDAENWLRGWNDAFPLKPIQGGLASGNPGQQGAQLYLDGKAYEEGGVAVAFGGDVGLLSVISQGCTPIGETWTITKVEQNFIHEIGNRPAYEVLAETFNKLPPDEQRKAQGNLLIGLVVNEYLEDFHRGDFLVRNILGGDPNSGSLAVGALPRQGQTMQFQRRDAAAATEDMNELLDALLPKLEGRTVYGGCLFNCNGRGHRLFGHPNHDAGLVQEKAGPLELTGFFCNGEIGPVGPRNFLHGYTASLALFTGKAKG
jgi:small ligand-binding sensory domain FIST